MPRCHRVKVVATFFDTRSGTVEFTSIADRCWIHSSSSSSSYSEARGHRHRRAAVAVEKEARVDEEVQSGTSHGAANGAAAGASKIRDAILEKPRSSSVYDYSDSPGSSKCSQLHGAGAILSD